MKIGSPPPPPPVLFCIGTEKWLREQHVRRLTENWIAPGVEEMDKVVYSEPPEDPRVILEALRTLPFGSAIRLVVVGGLTEAGEGALPWLAEILSHPAAKSCLLLCAERLERELAGRAQIVWCQPLKGKELERWVLEQAGSQTPRAGTDPHADAPMTWEHAAGSKTARAGIEPEAAALLIRRVGNQLQSLDQALESVSLLAGPSTRVTQAHVEALIVPSIRETAFELLDNVAAGRPEVGLTQMKAAVQQGRLTVEQWMGALGWYYRFAWKSRQGEGGSLRQAQGRLSWISPGRQAALNRLSRWSEGRLQTAMEEVLEAEVALKSGHPAPELLADQLLLKLGEAAA